MFGTLLEKGSLKGMATIIIDGFTIKNMQILQKKEPKEGERELFVAMPQYKTVENGQEVYKDMAFPLNSSVRWHMQETVLKEYDRLLSKQNIKQADKEKGEEQRMPPNMTKKSRTK